MKNSLFVNAILAPVVSHLGDESAAFFIAGESHSYKELASRISSLRASIALSNDDARIFGLAIHDDLDTYAAIFALWMEGRAYVPLHPGQPLDRNRNIIGQVGLRTVIDSQPTSPYDGLLNVIHTASLPEAALNAGNWTDPGDDALAYILFTSGSTGEPKGVTISRGNIASFMDAFWQTGISILPEDRCLQCFDLTFDVSVQSYLCALTRGACVYTVPYGQVKYLYAASLINDSHITFGAMAPSMLTYLRPYFDELDFSSLRQCILTAEACPVTLMEELYRVAPKLEIFDFYGPTEATIYCTSYALSRTRPNKSLNGIISIGNPLPGMTGIIIDEYGNELPSGEKGELVVAGPQLTPGYWKNDEKNVASFFLRGGVRFYHTGDLCYKDEDGDIMYSGRIDQQAKIQGFRVELGEIEYHARAFFNQAVRVAAIAFDNDKALTEIALFVEREPEDSRELEKYLRGKMPHYMIPTRFMYVPVFPLNKSEKLDRTELKKKLL